MKIFVRNLGEGVSRRELAAAVDRATRPPWYQFYKTPARMHQCDIMRLTDQESGTREYHGFVELAGVEAHLVLRRLNGLQIRGRDVEARRWIERNGPGDRRREDIGANLDRRHGSTERRRKLDMDFPGVSLSGVPVPEGGHNSH